MTATTRLSNRLNVERQRLFVGRTAELDRFRAALAAAELPYSLLAICGPEGIGKTTLLREFARLAEQQSVTTYRLDGRSVEPSPESFLLGLRAAMNLESAEMPQHALAAREERIVLLLDTYESLLPLDGWLRDIFLPQLTESVLVVLASAYPLALAWRVDPGWQSLIHTMPLRNLSPDECVEYLSLRTVPTKLYRQMLAFTHGHPLALSLVADVYLQRGDAVFEPRNEPAVVKVLLERFVQKAPGPAHRAALEVCALVRLTTETFLADLLEMDDVHELFEWLRGLSFVESGREGLFPHTLAREALLADLRWRNPDWYAELHRRARAYLEAKLRATRDRAVQQRILLNLIYLHRDNTALQPYFSAVTWEGGALLADVLRPEYAPALLAMVERYEGAESRRLAAHWLERQPRGVTVIRDEKQQPIGFFTALALDEISEADAALDPAIRVAHAYLRRHAPLRAGERATHFRFWMAADTYQGFSQIQVLLGVHVIRAYLMTPGLVFSFFPCAQPDFWEPILAYADLQRLPDAEFEIEGRHYGVFGHNWRTIPPVAWLDLMAEREMALAPSAAQPAPTHETLVALSEEAFAAVREALQAYARADRLRGNPLLRSRFLVERAGASVSPADRAAALQLILREESERLQASAKDAKLYRVLYHTYLQPAPTQEQAADLLNLPFSTYRRHLKAALAQVTDGLWRRELHGDE